ncbi:MAG: T9SS type A sorting domain-containing protein [Bacteroidota bacterium]
MTKYQGLWLLLCVWAGTVCGQYGGGAGDGGITAALTSGAACPAYHGDSLDGAAMAFLPVSAICSPFFGGEADGFACGIRANTDTCAVFEGGESDGFASGLRPNPVSCDLFEGGLADGQTVAFLANPDSCGQFEGGLADGNGVGVFLNPVPCFAFASGDRSDGHGLGELNGCLPLAVEASPLYGVLKGDDGELWWYTFSETNNLGFDLWRSGDRDQWEKIAFLPGQNLSRTQLKYEHLDTTMLPGINYYRFEQIDVDGSTVLSNIVALVRPSETGDWRLLVYPVPTKRGNQINVLLEGAVENVVEMQVVDAFGKIVKREAFEGQGDLLQTQISTAGWEAGLYFVTMRSQGRQLSARILLL